jgi:hypothetical protein
MQAPAEIRLDQHYTPQFYAELWNVSRDTIVRWFEDRPGVLKMSSPGRGKRRRVELRIPLSVAMEVYTERAQ